MKCLSGLALLFLFVSPVLAAVKGSTVRLEITLASDTQPEKFAESQLRRLLAKYNLDALVFTKKIRIASHVIPHSHPVLTLNTRHIDDDEQQLATFIHEQMHWYLSRHEKGTAAAIADLRKVYPIVPEKGPRGARNEHSTYLHLIINLLEFDGLANYLGRDRARAVIGRRDYYIWIYDTVLRDETNIRAVMTGHGLVLPSR